MKFFKNLDLCCICLCQMLGVKSQAATKSHKDYQLEISHTYIDDGLTPRYLT